MPTQFHVYTDKFKGDVFIYPWHSPKDWAMDPALFKASNITYTENFVISYYFKCQAMILTFMNNELQ